MDFTFFESQLQNIEAKPERIRGIVQYIIVNTSANQNEVAKIIEAQFIKLATQKQLAIFYLVSEILLVSNQKRNINFFKALAPKVKLFLESLSRSIEDVQDMKDICRILDKWAQEEIFAQSFMEKLKFSVRPFYSKIPDSREDATKEGFKKYKKTYLMEVYDIRAYPVSKELYEDFCIYLELQSKITNLNPEFNKLSLNSEVNEYTVNRSKQLLKIYNDLTDRMERILVKMQTDYVSLANWTQEEFEIFKKQINRLT